MEYADTIEMLRSDYPDLAAMFAKSDSLESVLDWLKGQDLPANSVDLIGQDEFSYDFLIPLVRQGRWLVFAVN